MEPSQYQPSTSGCVVAFSSVKTAKNAFMFILLLAILLQLASFVLVNWGQVVDKLHSPVATTSPTTQPADQQSVQAIGTATLWEQVFHWMLPATKFIGFVAALMAVVSLVFAVQLAIVGRLGGIAGTVSALLWSILLLAMVTPWQQVLTGSFAAGALYNLGELTADVARVKPEWGPTDVSFISKVIYYARYMAYPLLTLLVWLVVMVKFANGYKDSTISPIGTIKQHPSEPQI